VVGNVPLVGQTTSRLIIKLVQLKLTKVKNIHVIGFSLGAHVSGIIGMHIQNKATGLGEQIPRITGKKTDCLV
jgi:hypothetical protein